MEKLIIEGGKPLSGHLDIRGAKNSSDKCLMACLLTEETCELTNLAHIDDVKRILEIFEGIGVQVERIDNHTVRITAKNLHPENLDQEQVRKMRMSIQLIGPLLARGNSVKIASPGGDKIGSRQITTHLDALATLGAPHTTEQDLYVFPTPKLRGALVVLSEFSPTGTTNAILAAVLAEGTTIIKNAAAEPHIDNLMALLTGMGAKIRWIGNHIIEIEGVKRLHGVQHRVNPDYLEMGTFVAMAAATRSDITLQPFVSDYLESELLRFREMGVNIAIDGDVAHVKPSTHLTAPKERLNCMPYPGLASDNLPPFAVLATQAEGTTLIHEWMYEGRQRYLNDLAKMGANISILDPHRAIIKGPTPLYGKETRSYDVRSGAVLVIAALVAQGESTILEIEQMDRGYERLDERFKALGANITRISE